MSQKTSRNHLVNRSQNQNVITVIQLEQTTRSSLIHVLKNSRIFPKKCSTLSELSQKLFNNSVPKFLLAFGETGTNMASGFDKVPET